MDWTADISLERTVLVKVAGFLWRHVHATFLKDFRFFFEYWCFLEEKCVESVAELSLPKALSEKLKKIIKPIGLELLKFTYYSIGMMTGNICKTELLSTGIKDTKQSTAFNKCIKQIPVNIVWTVLGTVDTRETCKVLIDDDSLDLKLRYRLACRCCLEKSITILWKQMSAEQKSDVDSKCTSNLQKIWSLQKGNQKALREKANEAGFSCINEYSFIQSVKEHNKDGVRFFWKKLPLEVRRIVLRDAMRWITGHFTFCGNLPLYHECECSEVMEFLLSQDKELFNNLNIVQLTRFLDWPYHEYFIKILDSFPKCVKVTGENGLSEYLPILYRLIEKILFGFQDYDYGFLLKVIVRQAIKFEKQRHYSPLYTFTVFSEFCNDEVSLITSHCKNVLKKDVLLGESIFQTLSSVFESLSDDEEWDFITLIIDECILKSQDEIFRKVLKIPTRRVNYKYLGNGKLIYKVYCFLFDIILQPRLKDNHL